MRTYLVSILAALALAFAAAAAAGDYQDGRVAYDAGDFDTAMAKWAPAAESGDAASQYGMGLLYSEGIVVPMDDLQALKWFGLAAEQGHGEAQYKLGVMHANGWGVPMDEAEAMKWYELAAENGVTAAQVSLGTMYQNGFSVEQDKVEALKWFSIAVKLGDAYRNAEHFLAAEMTFLDGIEHAKGNPTLQVELLLGQARLLGVRAKHEDALDHLRRCLGLARQVDRPEVMLEVSVELARGEAAGAGLAQAIRERLRNVLVVQVHVELVPWGSLEITTRRQLT